MSIDLFQPYKIGKMELRNRFVRSATWDDTADSSGDVTEKSVAIYSRLAKGNIGLIVSGYAFISNQGQAVYGQYGVHTDKMIPGLRKLVRVVHQAGGKIAIQIVHAGISSDYLRDKGITPLAVSYLPEVKRTHREMSDEEIQIIIADFAAAARRGVEAGFDAVQLHGAHGYLMSQFISPLNNRRTDRWGGNAENRRRFHLGVIKSIRQAIGADFPLLIKIGVKDDREGGLALSEGVEAARLMAEAGIDAIEVSAGIGTSAQIVKVNEPERSFYRDRAAAVKQVVSVPVITVGGIRSLKMAQNIVDSGDADLISMSRPFIREPGLLNRWLKGEVEPASCITCNRCMAIVRRGEPLECGEERRQREEAAQVKTQ